MVTFTGIGCCGVDSPAGGVSIVDMCGVPSFRMWGHPGAVWVARPRMRALPGCELPGVMGGRAKARADGPR